MKKIQEDKLNNLLDSYEAPGFSQSFNQSIKDNVMQRIATEVQMKPSKKVAKTNTSNSLFAWLFAKPLVPIMVTACLVFAVFNLIQVKQTTQESVQIAALQSAV